MEKSRIVVSGLKTAGTGEDFRWTILPGTAYLVYGVADASGSNLLDHLAGRKLDKRLSIGVEPPHENGVKAGLPTIGLLPPPGEEIFAGTTIGEQLDFFARRESAANLHEAGFDSMFGLEFGRRRNSSVWELSAGERRCLLLVSQALANPRLWALHQPLAVMDGPRSRAIREFICRQCKLGHTVVAAQVPPLELIGCCPAILAVDGDGMTVKFSGCGRRAADFLVEETGVALSDVAALIEKTDKIE